VLVVATLHAEVAAKGEAADPSLVSVAPLMFTVCVAERGVPIRERLPMLAHAAVDEPSSGGGPGDRDPIVAVDLDQFASTVPFLHVGRVIR
jgi:hypothetical protein